MANIPVTAENYHTIRTGTKLSHSSSTGYATVGGKWPEGSVYPGQWEAYWVHVKSPKPSDRCAFDLHHLVKHKYYIVSNKPTVII